MDVTQEVSSKKPEFVQINNEAWRQYDFPNGGRVVIEQPVKLNVKRSERGDSHRLIDAQGICHYIPAGWIHLSWRPKDGVGDGYSF